MTYKKNIDFQRKSYLKMTKDEIRKQAMDFISFMPDVSEVLFYYVLFPVVKPFLASEKIYSNFMLVIIGPSGHLKTTLARLFAVWLEDEELQEIMFADITRQNVLQQRIKELEGLNLIVDDIHTVSNNYSKNKQVDVLDYLSRHCDSKKTLTNIIVTGEMLPKGMIFSSRDRMFQVYIPKKREEELENFKCKIRKLPENFMAQLAEKFSDILHENSDSVKRDISNFHENYRKIEKIGISTRIGAHQECLQIVEFLYRKYICDGNKQLSMKEQFEESLHKHVSRMYMQLYNQMKKEDLDYVEIVYEILSSENKYLQLETINGNYTASGDNFLFYNGKFYITRIALQKGFLRYLKETVSMKKVSEALQDAGVLEEDTDSRTKKFQGKRHYVISREAIELYCEIKKKQKL